MNIKWEDKVSISETLQRAKLAQSDGDMQQQILIWLTNVTYKIRDKHGIIHILLAVTALGLFETGPVALKFHFARRAFRNNGRASTTFSSLYFINVKLKYFTNLSRK